MKTLLASTTYPCKEYQKVQLPITDVFVDGRADVYPEVTGRGYFDVDFFDGQLWLTAKSFIGVIPINDRVNIHVLPRFPIDNIMYIVQRANSSLRYLPGYFRTYKVEKLVAGNAEELFAGALLDCLVGLERSGLLHRYLTAIEQGGLKGRLLISPTVTRFLSRGNRFMQVRSVSNRSVSLPENQFVKQVLWHIARYFGSRVDVASRTVSTRANALCRLFERVNQSHLSRDELARAIPSLIRRLPGPHRAYEQILWLCYLIATRQGISIEAFGPLQIETMLVNLADVFENYLRQVVRTNCQRLLAGSIVRDGNRHQVPMFVENDTFKVKPDIYLWKEGRAVVVIDAKYKTIAKASDRYQLVAFCEALQSKCAVILSPFEQGRPLQNYLGRTPSGIEMSELRFDLGAADILNEESRFIDDLAALIAKHLSGQN